MDGNKPVGRKKSSLTRNNHNYDNHHRYYYNDVGYMFFVVYGFFENPFITNFIIFFNSKIKCIFHFFKVKNDKSFFT